jgi:hypothetical protein
VEKVLWDGNLATVTCTAYHSKNLSLIKFLKNTVSYLVDLTFFCQGKIEANLPLASRGKESVKCKRKNSENEGEETKRSFEGRRKN